MALLDVVSGLASLATHRVTRLPLTWAGLTATPIARYTNLDTAGARCWRSTTCTPPTPAPSSWPGSWPESLHAAALLLVVSRRSGEAASPETVEVLDAFGRKVTTGNELQPQPPLAGLVQMSS